MVSERRTAEDALEISGDVKDFIARGFVDNTTQRESTESSDAGAEPANDTQAATEKGNTDRPSKGATSRKPGKSTRSRRSQTTGRGHAYEYENSRAHAKATVQKTVRFQPSLIARLEHWIRVLEDRGEGAPSFQQVQNDALKLWLEKHAE